MLTKINKIYVDLLKQLVKAPKVNNTREINNVKITLPAYYNPFVTLTDRKLSPSYALGELIWYFTGRNDKAFITKFSNFWNSLSDDGKTSNSAYGYMIHKKYNFDQLEQVVKILSLDPYSRRAVININYAHNNKLQTKDEQCTIALQFMVRNDRLMMTSIMRSNDIWFGFPYDIIYFRALQMIIADTLEVKLGKHTHFVTSLHLYDKDYEAAKKIIKQKRQFKPFVIDFLELKKKAKFLEALVEKLNTDNEQMKDKMKGTLEKMARDLKIII
jgi:thymidylate synthase